MNNHLRPRESHLFASHKFLEETGSKILSDLAKVDFRNLDAVKHISKRIEDYAATIVNHARWEDEFIFNKFFTKDEIAVFHEDHVDLETQAERIIATLKTILDTDARSRVHDGKSIYLEFRMFYASNLMHFHKEETILLNMLQERATDDEIRAIDKPIYQHMSSNDMIDMLEHLFPPLNFSEKKNILADLRDFNPEQFDNALPQIRKMLSQEEVAEIFI